MTNIIESVLLLTCRKKTRRRTRRTVEEEEEPEDHPHHHQPSVPRLSNSASQSLKKSKNFKRHSNMILNYACSTKKNLESSRSKLPTDDRAYRKSWSFFSSNHQHYPHQQHQRYSITCKIQANSTEPQVKLIDHHHPTRPSIDPPTTTTPIPSPTSSSSSSSSTSHPYSHHTISQESFTSAEEGDQSIWDHHHHHHHHQQQGQHHHHQQQGQHHHLHHQQQGQHHHHQQQGQHHHLHLHLHHHHPNPPSSLLPFNPKTPTSIRFDHHHPSPSKPSLPPLNHLSSHQPLLPPPSHPSSSNSHPQHQLLQSLTPPPLLPPPQPRTIFISNSPPEFRIARIFNPSELDLSQLNLPHHDHTPDHHPTIPSNNSHPSLLEILPTPENTDMLSRIAQSFNSLLSSPPNSSCLLPIRRHPSSHSLAFRFQSGLLHRVTSKSCLNPHHLIRPNTPNRPSRSTSVSSSPRPRSATTPSTRKSISMTFSLRHHHPPQDHQYHHPRHHHHHHSPKKKVSTHHRSKDSIDHRLRKPSKIQIIIPHQPSNHPQRLPSTWRDSCSPDRYQRFYQRFGSLEIKRQEVIWELCQTELSYIDSLELIIRVFYEPLRTRLESSSTSDPLIIPFEIINSFHRLIDIINLHRQLHQSLPQNRRQSNPIKEEEEEEEEEEEDQVGLNHPISSYRRPIVILRIADTFQAFVDRLRIYQPYLSQFESINELIHDVTHDPNSRLGNLIRSQAESEECNKMSLNSFLLKPIQRLMKYPLFFKQLCDLTPPSHPDHRASQTLWRRTDELIREMQDLKVIEGQMKLIHSPPPSSYNLSIQSRPPPPPPMPPKVSSSFTRS